MSKGDAIRELAVSSRAAVIVLLLSVLAHLPGPASGATEGQEAYGAPWVSPPVLAYRVSHQTFWSDRLDTLVSYHIFVPELYERAPERRFPVLYWLHGSGGGLEGIPSVAGWFAHAMMAGKMPPMLVVFPNGLDLSLWADAKDGSVPMETILIHELIPHLDEGFRTEACREGRILEGFSMGGYGAARLGFKYHDLFSAVSILAGGPLQQDFGETPRASPARREEVFKTVFGGDMAYYQALSPWVLAEENATELSTGTRIRLVIGELDEMLEVNLRFHKHLVSLGIPHELIVIPHVAHAPRPLQAGLGEEGWGFYWTGRSP